MKITLELDTELMDLIAFIPENQLNTILVSLLKEAICGRSAARQDAGSGIEEMKNLAKLIEGISKGDTIIASPHPENTKAAEALPVPAKQIVISTADLADADIDKEFFDMMK